MDEENGVCEHEVVELVADLAEGKDGGRGRTGMLQVAGVSVTIGHALDRCA
jgi:hypothetical protein